MSKLAKRPMVAMLAAITSCGLLVSCASSEDTAANGDSSEFDIADGISPTKSFANVPEVQLPPDNAALGNEDQELGEVGADPNIPYTNETMPIDPDWMIAGEFYDHEITWAAIDPEDGEVKARITTGPAIWNDVAHVFTTTDASEPQAIAFEVWRPRASRGTADFVISTYSGNLLEPAEINLPKHTRFHSRVGSHTFSENGQYMISWDDELYGPRVVNLENAQLSGEVSLPGCGPFVWPVGDSFYSVCEQTSEVIELAIGDDGSVTETARAEVLPDDFTSSREAHFAKEVKHGFLINEAGDAFVFDLSEGLPSADIAPIGNVGRDEGRFYKNGIRPDGAQFFVQYTDTEIHPHSANGGDVASIRLFDTEGATETRQLTLEDLDLASINSSAYNLDGSVFYILGTATVTGEDGEETDETTLIGIDPATGDTISRVAISGNADDVSSLRAPERLGQ